MHRCHQSWPGTTCARVVLAAMIPSCMPLVPCCSFNARPSWLNRPLCRIKLAALGAQHFIDTLVHDIYQARLLWHVSPAHMPTAGAEGTFGAHTGQPQKAAG